MFKKLYFPRSRSRTAANSKNGAICDNSLQLKAAYYSIVTRSSILNAGNGPRTALITMVFRKILGQLRNISMKSTKIRTI